MIEDGSFVFAFAAGLLAFFSPCVLPLVPVYLASVCGLGILESGAGQGRLTIFLHTLSFVLGFSLVFTILGAGAGLVGLALGSRLLTLRVAGSLLIAFGLFLLAALKFPQLNYEKRLNPSLGATTGYLRSLTIGIIFSFGWSPCLAGLAGGTLLLAFGSMTVWQGASLLGFFSFGLSLPFLTIGLAFDWARPYLRVVHRYSTLSYIIGGLLLIVIGILIILGKFG